MMYRLASLLFRKKTSFVGNEERDYKQIRLLRKNGLPKEFSEFEHDKICIIDLKTGNQSTKLYHSINLTFLFVFGFRIDYDACKKEAERIRKEIDRSKTTDLIAGI